MTKSVFTKQYIALRDELVSARKRANMTQVDLAAALGRPQSFVSKYENGERRLDLIELFEVTTALSADLNAIVRNLGKIEG